MHTKISFSLVLLFVLSLAKAQYPSTDVVWNDWKNHSSTKAKEDIPWDIKHSTPKYKDWIDHWINNNKNLNQPPDGASITFSFKFDKDAEGYGKEVIGIYEYVKKGGKWEFYHSQALVYYYALPNFPPREELAALAKDYLNSPDRIAGESKGFGKTPGIVSILKFDFKEDTSDNTVDGVVIKDKTNIEYRYAIECEYAKRDYRGRGTKIIEKKNGTCILQAALTDGKWTVTDADFAVVTPARAEVIEKAEGSNFLPLYATIDEATFDELYKKRKEIVTEGSSSSSATKEVEEATQTKETKATETSTEKETSTKEKETKKDVKSTEPGKSKTKKPNSALKQKASSKLKKGF